MKTHFYILRFSSMCFCEPVQSLLAFPVFNFVLLTPPAILSRLWWKKNKKQKTNLKKKAGWGDLPLYPHMNSLYLKENMQRPQRFKKHSSHSSWWVFKKKKKRISDVLTEKRIWWLISKGSSIHHSETRTSLLMRNCIMREIYWGHCQFLQQIEARNSKQDSSL